MTVKDFIVSKDASLREAMNLINQNAVGILFICEDGRLTAAISDGDIRRAIIKGAELSDPIENFANHNPISLSEEDKADAEKVMRDHEIVAIPVVNVNGAITDIKFLLKEELKKSGKVDVPVAIMAGGRGTRLKPYTDILPKPLIPIGEKTITEHIIDRFSDFGCWDFYMIVNYKKEFIKAYFTDKTEEHFKSTPKFVDETEFLGTGGGLSLLKGLINSTFFLTNCDILIDMDYKEALEKHKRMKNIITMVCADKKLTIPYGTVITDEDGYIKELKEKPTYRLQTNTGFYIIEPEFLQMVPDKTRIDITDLIEQCIKAGKRVGSFLINDSDWMDMGQLEEMEKMKEKLGIN